MERRLLCHLHVVLVHEARLCKEQSLFLDFQNDNIIYDNITTEKCGGLTPMGSSVSPHCSLTPFPQKEKGENLMRKVHGLR